jgi:hypothetical protein
MIGIETIAMTGLLTLASAGAAQIECHVPQAPQIDVVPKTAPTAYDYSKTTAELTEIKTSTVSPYGGHSEQLTFGLHEGHMKLSYQAGIGGMTYPDLDLACLHYSNVKITLELNPVIYVVREMRPGTCAHKAVLEHEKKHVRVDRDIANKYAREIGLAVQKAVNDIGAVGPFNIHEMENRQKMMQDHISSTISALQLKLFLEQSRRQQDVDSLEEYERVGTHIRDTCKFDIGDEMRKSLKKIRRAREQER